MKADRGYTKAIITEKGANWVNSGHPWIFEDEVIEIAGNIENGCIVDAVSAKGRYIGSGFISLNSKIRIRLISGNANDKFDADFWRRRVEYAWNYRKTVMGDDVSCCRVIFGEADKFPGLTVDRFNDILVTQTLSIGMEKIKDILFPIIFDVLKKDGQNIKGIYERNDVAIRELEGMEQNKGWFKLSGIDTPESTETVITENGIKYNVDVENGQKTGFFLDQKYNRLAVSKLTKGKKVLDCFTHTGSFALNAANGGALSVTAADISETAIEMAKRNAEMNGLADRMSFLVTDIFDFLPTLKKGEYDFIILDPPAFTKSRKTVATATKGYKEINYEALKALPRGGYFATCSCSHFMPDELFVKMLKSAAKDASVELRQIEARQQAPDHPILWNVPETDYLKFYIFQVV